MKEKVKIRKAALTDIPVLKSVIIESFLAAHGKAAPKEFMDDYVAKNFSETAIEKKILDSNNLFYILLYNEEIVGFSKIILNEKNINISAERITKMERLYILPKVYGKGLGKQLFNFNVELAKENNQKGMWLYVWENNKRAINFYTKMKMSSVGNFDFPVSKKVTRPNHVMYLQL